MRLSARILACFFIIASAMVASLYGQNRSPIVRDEGMERMAEILGALHYLDNLCNGNSEEWRHFMDRLLLTENSSTPLHRRLISSFNRSYRAFAENHHQCNLAAKEAIKLYRQEGVTLSNELVNRYGN